MEHVGSGGDFLAGGRPERAPQPGDGTPSGRAPQCSGDAVPSRESVLKGDAVNGNPIELGLTSAIAGCHYSNRDPPSHEGAGKGTDRSAGEVTRPARIVV